MEYDRCTCKITLHLAGNFRVGGGAAIGITMKTGIQITIEIMIKLVSWSRLATWNARPDKRIAYCVS